MKAFFSLLLIAAIAGVVYFKFFMNPENAGAPGMAGGQLPITAYEVSKQSIFDSVEALGTAYANESIDITANATETIETIRFEDGQQVEKGDIIVVLEQQEEQAQLRAAEAQLKEHERELSRLNELLENKAASKREYDERNTQLEVTRQALEEVRARIADRTLRAPFDGVLGLRRLSVGALVQPGAIITTLDDIHPIKLDFNVPDIYLAKLEQGMGIEANSVSAGDTVFKGTISRIDSRVDPVTRSVRVRAIVPNENGLIKPGILMHVTLLKDEREAILVPEETVFQKQSNHYVMAIDAATKQIMQREVEVGARRPGVIEIIEGLKEGDLIVIRGIHLVGDGMSVTIKDTWTWESYQPRNRNAG